MLLMEKEQADFCREFNITSEAFRNACLTWEELDRIAVDFKPKRSGRQNTVKRYADALQDCSGVHSLSYRVKDTMHLIEKIIRKNPEYMEKGEFLCKANYEKKITDLMGIRLLTLFKEDWLDIHDRLIRDYADCLWESPFVYLREGDDDSLYRDKVDIRKGKGYRSVHYVIRSDEGPGIEIQVRTLYEEAWGEIDHRLRYPYDLTNEMLTNYLTIMNRLTGMGDEMGTFIHRYIEDFRKNLHAGNIGNDVNMESLSELLKKIL